MYNKGFIQNAEPWIHYAKQKNIPIIVDPKGLNFKQYKGVELLKPNLSEFMAIVGDCESEEILIKKARNLLINLNINNILITCGSKGMYLINNQDYSHIPTKAKEVFDVTGAGDTVVAGLACAKMAGLDWLNAAKFANLAAGISVGKLGTATVSLSEIEENIYSIENNNRILSLDKILAEIYKIRKQNHDFKLVVTNDCFDILHLGHVKYLEQAKKLGDKLIVLVNSDSSVKKLKGSSRPINNLVSRMQVLSGLRSVDWVVKFEEESPFEIIKCLKPDIYVKGGDYKLEQFDNFPEVLWIRKNGGVAKLLEHSPGYSTTCLLKSLA